MKTGIITLILALAASTGFSQSNLLNFKFEHTGGRARIVNKAIMETAKTLKDIGPEFEGSCRKIGEYVSVEISMLSAGNLIKATGDGPMLTADQNSILKAARMGDEVLINISFRPKDDMSTIIKTEYAVTPGPQVDAEYPGGPQELSKYMEEQVIKKVAEKDAARLLGNVCVAFTVDEQGEISIPQIFRRSEDPAVDKLVLDAIHRMPKWSPAKNANGTATKQQFIVSIPTKKGGC